MRACIYARTSQKEKRHNTTSIPNQIAQARELALQHNLTVSEEHIHTDIEIEGRVPPTCWAREDEDSRPALSAMIETIETGSIDRVIVRRIEKLATSSDTLLGLLQLFERHDVYVVANPEVAIDPEDPNAVYALSVLKPRIIFDTDAERERKERLRARKLEEIERLKAKLERLETELKDL